MVTVAPFPKNSGEVIRAIINEIGRDVFFYYPTSFSGCSDCSLDPITNTSTDSFCQVCSGQYWIPTFSGMRYTAKVTWNMSELPSWMTGGIVENGDCTVQIAYSGGIEDVIFSSEYVMVDNREMDVKDVMLRGVPNINRVLVVLKEKERT